MDKKTIYCIDRIEWREWLLAHFESEKEIWFVFPAVSSNEPGVTYNDAVEEALCFGWIDGVAGTLDKTHNLRRFTPRRKNSPYSRLNIERLINLYNQDLIHPKFKKEIKKIISKPFVFPKDIIAAIKKDKVAWKNYQ